VFAGQRVREHQGGKVEVNLPEACHGGFGSDLSRLYILTRGQYMMYSVVWRGIEASSTSE
jgi:hypothetical protein